MIAKTVLLKDDGMTWLMIDEDLLAFAGALYPRSSIAECQRIRLDVPLESCLCSDGPGDVAPRIKNRLLKSYNVLNTKIMRCD